MQKRREEDAFREFFRETPAGSMRGRAREMWMDQFFWNWMMAVVT
jgi:hypothetical protein